MFEVFDSEVTDEDVIRASYSTSNPIEHRVECSLDEMMSGVHNILSIMRGFGSLTIGYRKCSKTICMRGISNLLNVVSITRTLELSS